MTTADRTIAHARSNGFGLEGCRNYARVGPFFIYLIFSFLFIGRGLVGHLSDHYIGVGPDPGAFIFFLEWWKYAFVNHLNPFFTQAQWAPSGVNLAWSTFIPLFGVLGIPLTITLGPVATYNILMLLCPPLSAWTGFLLYRYLCSSWWPALIGGYIYGFSPYILGHLLGHLALVAVFPLPLMAEITLLRLNYMLSATAYAAGLAALLILQFLCFPGLAATATIFGAAAMACAWWMAPQWRTRLRRLILPTMIAYITNAFFLSPYLYYLFTSWQSGFHSTDNALVGLLSSGLSDFVIPTTSNLLGAIPAVRKISDAYRIQETGSYIAFPIVLIVMSLARSQWQYWNTRMLLALLGIGCVASVGPMLHIGGFLSIPMPWLLFSHLPLMDTILPARFSVYCFLILGIIVSRWLSEDAIDSRMRILGACGIVLFGLPNISASYWATSVDTPSFFTNRLYIQYLSRGENVLIVPYGRTGNSDIWQATSGLYFRMAGGYVGSPLMPGEFVPFYPLVSTFFNLAEFPCSSEMLKAFLAQKHISAVILADQRAHFWKPAGNHDHSFLELSATSKQQQHVIRTLLGSTGIKPIEVGGVLLYKVPTGELLPYKYAQLEELQMRIASSQLNTLIIAARNYLAAGLPLANLNPAEAGRLGLLPPFWVAEGGLGIFNPSASPRSGVTLNGLTLIGLINGDILTGVVASQKVVRALAAKYRPYSKLLDLVPLAFVRGSGTEAPWMLLLVYDRAGLGRAAAQICMSRDWISAVLGASHGKYCTEGALPVTGMPGT
jgi:hypothetical protein